VLKTNRKPVETEPPSSPLTLARFAKEPLVHFVFLGAAVYLLFSLFGPSESDAPVAEENTIVVTKGEINWLGEMWQKKWNRPPTDAEMIGLVRNHLRETVLYREAIAMGLDKDDVIIRRRLAQKLEFAAQDLIQPERPTDEELKAHFQKNIDRYRTPDLLTFTHAFLDPDKRGDQTLQDAEKLKAELIAGSQTPDASSDLGDRFMLQSYYPERSEADLAKLFGGEFARSIMELDPEKWHGPILSGYGTHLVYVHARLVSPPPTYQQVADRVREDLENEKRTQLNDEYIDSLLERYKVVIEGEDSEDDQDAVTEVPQ
jgi:hypothetical protein